MRSSELLGRCENGVWIYQGIPYATLEDRFGPPRPPPSGFRDATAPGPTAPQAELAFGPELLAILGPGWEPGPDYLTVDVWTPDSTARDLPVMVFVHGGGFLGGSGQASMYEGTAFARDGVVLVTLNYRLGAIGWLDLPGVPRNRGLLDVLAALGWVRDHIAGFGGDPGNVTLFGQSAGAMLIAALLAVPGAERLVRRAISQSGGAHTFRPDQAARVTAALAERLGVAPTGKAFARIGDADLVQAVSGLRVDTRYDRSLGVSPFKPVVDGALDLAPVDFLIGTNENEADMYVFEPVTDADLLAAATRRHPEPEWLAASYRARFTRPAEQLSALMTEQFETGSARLAQAHRGRVWTYRFGLEGRAPHCAELPFVFRSGPVHDAWVRFATIGDPGWAPLPELHRLSG
ncbi:carboxylesterase family protein [Amycolatopsis sp. PS_44_ISF1]|uniref:carboxylesterase family protein n=1 Tax=Amycolatopsis sp. PS_44_ISF1 TaxID=2974917 RepID=UPI0028DF6875|nr:carboxylesterase family protein [Amycolatopsis sp. PS_44_ISF1]MDT8915413.1 carboxylesterase family protein [Amycolatopsis sp. PS_44_ISF1]